MAWLFIWELIAVRASFQRPIRTDEVMLSSFRLKRRQQERRHDPGHVDGQFRMTWKRFHRALALAVGVSKSVLQEGGAILAIVLNPLPLHWNPLPCRLYCE
jgi:hypothetical protein